MAWYAGHGDHDVFVQGSFVQVQAGAADIIDDLPDQIPAQVVVIPCRIKFSRSCQKQDKKKQAENIYYSEHWELL
jgi:hypothetical protein